MREYRATVGATDGNIIAAIITIHTPTNQPSVPRPDHGPSSMPCIRSAVHAQPATRPRPAGTRERDEERDQPEPRANRRERGREPRTAGNAFLRGGDHGFR